MKISEQHRPAQSSQEVQNSVIYWSSLWSISSRCPGSISLNLIFQEGMILISSGISLASHVLALSLDCPLLRLELILLYCTDTVLCIVQNTDGGTCG